MGVTSFAKKTRENNCQYDWYSDYLFILDSLIEERPPSWQRWRIEFNVWQDIGKWASDFHSRCIETHKRCGDTGVLYWHQSPVIKHE